jgi:hypothetical protein
VIEWWYGGMVMKMMENQSSIKVDRMMEGVEESVWMKGKSGETSGRGENEQK